MSWRPDNFKNPYGDEWFISACQHQYDLGSAYEEGFNDCVEALKKTGKYNTSGYGRTDFPNARYGWFVFIPDEEG